MSYQDQHDIAMDKRFQERITMCVAEQAEIFVNDDRPQFKQLAFQAIAALEATAVQFVPLVSVRPGMSAGSTDGDILAAVQYVWPLVGARFTPLEPLPPIQAPL